MKANQELRDYAKSHKIYGYQIAKRLNLSETYYSRLLREELDPEMRYRVRHTISELVAEREYCLKLRGN